MIKIFLFRAKIVRELSSFGMISTETEPKPNRNRTETELRGISFSSSGEDANIGVNERFGFGLPKHRLRRTTEFYRNLVSTELSNPETEIRSLTVYVPENLTTSVLQAIIKAVPSETKDEFLVIGLWTLYLSKERKN